MQVEQKNANSQANSSDISNNSIQLSQHSQGIRNRKRKNINDSFRSNITKGNISSDSSDDSYADARSDSEIQPMINSSSSNISSPAISGRAIHENTNSSHAFWNLTKGFVGAASFALPWAVSKTGVFPAIIGFALLCVLSALTFRWLLIASHFAGKNLTPTYPELAEIVFSNFFPLFSKGNQLLQQSSPLKISIDSENQQLSEDEKECKIKVKEHILLINQENAIERKVELMEIKDDNTREMKNFDKIIDANSIAEYKRTPVINSAIPHAINEKYKQANRICGKLGKIIVYISMFLGMIGACGSYLLFISSVLYDWLQPIFPFVNHENVLFLLLPLPILLSMLRSYKFLSITAKFGVAGVVLALGVTMYDGMTRIRSGIINSEEIYSHVIWMNVGGFPIFVGNACFLFIIHLMVLSQEQSMQDRTQAMVSKQFTKASMLSLFLVTIVNTFFGIFAYITFSDYPTDSFDNIVNVLDAGPLKILTKFCLCIDLLFTYALIMYPFTEAIDSEIFDPLLLNTRGILWKGNIIRFFLVIITALIAMFIPYFGYLTGLTGGSASVFIGLVLPPIFIWRLAPHKIYRFELYFLCPAVFLFGCVMAVWSPYLIISEMHSKM